MNHPSSLRKPQTPSQFLELELKFLFSRTQAPSLREKILKLPGVSYEGRVYEKTSMLDNAEQRMNKEDARLRVRQISSQKGAPDCRIEFSYKRRLKAKGGIKEEEEIETSFSTEIEPFFKILEKMGYYLTTSYERYRETYQIGKTKITLDEFPFGYILEIEGERETIKKLCRLLQLKMKESYPLSCDDAYVELCRKNQKEPKPHILFDDPEMPQW